MKITTFRCLFTSALLAIAVAAAADRMPWTAAHASSSSQPSKSESGADKDVSPEERMQKRFPHPVRVGFLVGLPVLDNDDNTLGYVQRVVRTPAGKIHLIVRYGGWFGWIGWWQRPVAVPLELVGMLGAAVAALEMFPADFRQAPTWSAGDSKDLGLDETIKVALTKR